MRGISGREISKELHFSLVPHWAVDSKSLSGHVRRALVQASSCVVIESVHLYHLFEFYSLLALWIRVYTAGKKKKTSFLHSSIAMMWSRDMHTREMGRHVSTENTEMAIKDLRALSIYLGKIALCYYIRSRENIVVLLIGTKPFFTGSKPTEADCAIFGVLAQIVWAVPGSFLGQLVSRKFFHVKYWSEILLKL